MRTLLRVTAAGAARTEENKILSRPCTVMQVAVGPSPRFLFSTSEGSQLSEHVARAWDSQQREDAYRADIRSADAVLNPYSAAQLVNLVSTEGSSWPASTAGRSPVYDR